MKKKRIIAILLVALMILTLASCSGSKKDSADGEADTTASDDADSEDNDSGEQDGENFTYVPEEVGEYNEEFAAFVDEQYKTSIEESYIAMHIYYLDPEAAGFDLDNVSVQFDPVSDGESMEEDRTYYKSLKTALEGFDRSSLSREQQDEYDSMEWEIDSMLKLCDEKFDYYSQLFAPPESLEANIVSYLSNWELRNEREVQELIPLLDSLPAYVDSAVEYGKKQQELELFMTDFDDVITGCDDVLEMGTDSVVLSKLLEQVDDIDSISDEQKSSYKDEITAAFERSYLPSFEKIKAAMEEMKDGYNNTEGYATFPNGAEYFEALLNYSMGTYEVSCQEAKDFLEGRNQTYMMDLMSLYAAYPDDVNSFFDESPETGYTDYDSILQDVEKKMLEDHPEVKNLEYNIEPADPEEKLDEKNVAAYFLIPPVDGDHKQQMRVNPSNDEAGSIDTYVTVTHEGFPGHMYQYAYMFDAIDSDYIKTLGVDANVEGYAVYSEYGALDYLEDLSPAAAEVYALNNKFMYIEYSLVDIGINYDGWSLEDTKDYFEAGGYSLDDDTVKEVYDFLRYSPATYEPYGYGYELIAELRENAESILDDKFDAKGFNKALLDAGPTPHKVVERHINDYIYESLQ